MNLLNSVCSFGPPWEGRGKMKDGEKKKKIPRPGGNQGPKSN